MALTDDKWDIRAFLDRIETTEGVDIVPDPATHAVLLSDGQVEVREENLERTIDQPAGGAKPRSKIRRYGAITGNMELTGAATAGQEAPGSSVIQSSGHSQTLLVANPGPPEIFNAAQYRPILRNIPSSSSYFYHDGEFFKLVGVRGRFTSIAGAINAFPNAGIERMGKLLPILEADVPNNADTSRFQEPVVGTEDETAGAFADLTINLDGTVLEGVSFNHDPGVNMGMRFTTESTRAVHRTRAGTGTIRIFRPTLATKDIRAIVRSRARVPMEIDFLHDDDFRCLNFFCPTIQLDEPRLVNADGDKAWDIGYVALPDQGNDDYTLTFGKPPATV